MNKLIGRRKLKTSHAIDRDLVEYLQAVAEREGITRSLVINRLVRDRMSDVLCDFDTKPTSDVKQTGLRIVSIDKLIPDPRNERRTYSDESIAEMAEHEELDVFPRGELPVLPRDVPEQLLAAHDARQRHALFTAVRDELQRV